MQAAPTGFTAIVDADGNVRQRTAVSEQRVLYDTIELRDGRTWYTNLGDGPFIAALIAVLAASLWFARRRQQQPVSAQSAESGDSVDTRLTVDDSSLSAPTPSPAIVLNVVSATLRPRAGG